jgi:predicted nucleic acid-binding Zn ribbon protein
VSVGRIDVGVAVEEAWYERDAATGVRGEWATGGVGGAAVVVLRHCACGRACAVRFLAASSTKHATAVKASGYLFNVRRVAATGKWYAEITLRGVHVYTRLHKHTWQAAAELEWQLARWCAHTGQPRSRYVSNAARLVELGRADAAGVLTEAVTVAPWELSRWDGSGGKAAPAGERLLRAGC